MRYDTVIIGAGLSGLAAGIRLAYFDKSVLILERHTTIGGLNSFYRLRNRTYDVGLHAVTNYAEPGTKSGPLSKLLRQLRLRWEDFDLRPQNESAVVFPGHTLRFTNNFDYLFSQVRDLFPKQIDGFRKLLDRIRSHDALDLNRQPVSGRQVVGEYISDPLLIDMLFCPLMFYGSATARDMDFNQFVIMFKSIFFEGFGRPLKGIKLILSKLVKHFKNLGGEIRLRSGVSEIQHTSDHATSLVLDDGTELEADNILSSAGSAETMRMCSVAPKNAIDSKPGEISFMESISVLDREPASFGHNETIIFYNDTPEFIYDRPSDPIDLRSGIICSPNNFEFDESLPEGKVRITALAEPDYWMNLGEHEYATEKEVWHQRIIEAALRHIPDFRPHVIDSDAFTPRTIRRFTGHLNGCVYGAPRKFVDGTTHLRNLFLCGTDQGFLGIVGAMLSGITIANKHLLRP